MLTLKRNLFLLMSIFLVETSQAKSEVEFLATDDRVMYNQLITMCEAKTNSEYTEKSALWFNSFVNSGIFDTVVHKKVTKDNPFYETSPALKKLVMSQGFFMAMNHCFGQDESSKTLFFYSLVALDISGKLTSWVVDITFLRSIYWGSRGFIQSAKLSSLELTKRLFWFEVFYNQSLHLGKAFGTSVYKIVTPLFVTAGAGQFYSTYKKLKNSEDIQAGKTPEKKAQLLQELSQLKKFKNTVSDQQSLIDVDMLISEIETELKQY